MKSDTVKTLKQAVLIASIAVFAFMACRSTKQNLNRPVENANSTANTPKTESPFNVVESNVIERQSPFDHNRPEHQTKTKDCAICHQRADNSPVPKLPDSNHVACIECHQRDFTTQSSRMCVVCHETPAAKKNVIPFPAKLDEFGIKAFSHKTHLDPAKMKDQKQQAVRCDDCHKFDARGVQASFPKHPECFSCHVHEAGGKLSGCDACHAPKAQAVAFNRGVGVAFNSFNFRHGPHIKKAECERCHKTTDVPTDQPRPDMLEINLSSGQRHTSTCWSCHVQAREPVCGKCHIASRPF